MQPLLSLRPVVVAALVWAGLSAIPTSAQNLLVNGNFENGPLGGIPSGWTGYGTGVNRKIVKDTGAPQFIYMPTPTIKEGIYCYVEGYFLDTAGNAGIRQQVNVTTGQPYTLLGWWHVGDMGNSWHEVGIFNGNVSDATILAGAGNQVVQIINKNGEASGWEFFQRSFTPTANQVTVYTKLGGSATSGTAKARANWIDDLQLVAGTPAQHTVTAVSPRVIPNNSSNTIATVTGSGLDGVSTVKLKQGAAELVATAVTPIGPGYTSLTCTFPTSGAAAGLYDLIITKPSAPTQDATLTGAFRIRQPGGNLLVNGDFEIGPALTSEPITGWTRYTSDWGKGELGTPDAYAIRELRVDGVARIHCPQENGQPKPAYGNYSFRAYEYGYGGEAGILQTVDVIPGETLLLSFKWGGGNTLTPAAFEVGVMSGTRTTAWNTPPDLGLVRLDNPSSWGWIAGSETITIPQGVDTITVFIEAWHFTADWEYMAVYVDDMLLIPDPGCPDQHTLSSISPMQHDVIGEFDLTVNGTNLTAVTAIRLVRGQDQYIGAITSASGTQLVAHFVLPAGGAAQGDYDVVTEQTGCLAKRLAGALELGCYPTSLSGVSPNTLTKPQKNVELTVSGVNIDRFAKVELVYMPDPRVPPGDRAPYWVPITTATGTIVNADNPNAVVMEFDLFNLQAGRYKLVGTRLGPCGSPAEAIDAFNLSLPPEGPNLLANGDFESGLADPWVLAVTPGLPQQGNAPPEGPQIVTNPSGQYWGNMPPSNGSSFAGTRAIAFDWDHWMAPNGGTIEQTIPVPAGPDDYDLILLFKVRMWNHALPGSTLVATIEVDNGAASSSTTAGLTEYGKLTMDGWDSYTQLLVDYSGPINNSITVRFTTWTGSGDQAYPYGVIAIDEVRLVGQVAGPSCNTPFADTDADGDVDQDDFGVFQLCFSGPLGSIPTSVAGYDCKCLDRNLDNHLTQEDFSLFQNCAGGPMMPWQASANCP